MLHLCHFRSACLMTFFRYAFAPNANSDTSRATPNHKDLALTIALVVPLYKMGRLLAMTNQAHACARSGALARATWSYAWL